MGKIADLTRGPLPQDAATVATGLKHLNGEEAQTGHEHCATRAGYVSPITHFLLSFLMLMSLILDYAKLTRKMGSKSSNAGSNLRPKEMSQGSP